MAHNRNVGSSSRAKQSENVSSMASDDSTNSPDLIVGSLVTFTSRRFGQEYYYLGTVYFFNPENACFGIEEVSCTGDRGGYHCPEGCYQFDLKDIKDLMVLSGPIPKPTTDTTKDDQRSGASSSSTPHAK